MKLYSFSKTRLIVLIFKEKFETYRIEFYSLWKVERFKVEAGGAAHELHLHGTVVDQAAQSRAQLQATQ